MVASGELSTHRAPRSSRYRPDGPVPRETIFCEISNISEELIVIISLTTPVLTQELFAILANHRAGQELRGESEPARRTLD